MSGFIDELRRRRVIRVAVVYAIAGWVVIEVASTILPGLHLPGWTVTFVIALVVLGFPLAVIMGWMFDLGPRGIERTPAGAAVEVAAASPAASEPAGNAAAANGSPRRAGIPAAGGEPETGRRTIAVLPFVNMSGDAENEYFSDGISEEILNLLTKLPQLKVSSRTSSFFFKGSKINIPMVARELGVSTVLEGSVRRAADRVRITAQLIETDTDSHLWSDTYDREMKDVFAIQDDIARSIVEALKVALTPKQRRAIQYVATSDVQAYDFYLRGRQYFYGNSRRDLQHAIGMYQQAIALDPNYALAWAGVADAYSYLYRIAEASAANAANAIDASQRAVALDADSAEAHASSGLAHFINTRYDEAEQHFETAMLLNPNLFEAYFFYGMCCSSQGSFDKAARLYRQAAEVNPADYNPAIYLALAYGAMGRRDDELAARRHALELVGQHLQMTPDDARARYLGATILAALGERAKAVEWAELALQAAGDEPNVLYNVACTFAQLSEQGRAMDLLEQAVTLGWGYRAWLENDADLASLRGHPRFRAVLERLH